jgi:osmotically-inducible protein OsmY
MKNPVLIHNDVALKDQVLAELKWEPSVNEAHIGVTADGGIITLMGTVPTWPERSAAERAALRVSGVKAVANDLRVKLPGDVQRTDADIAREAASALNWNTYVPKDRIKVAVHEGTVTLTGEVEWQYQRIAAEDAVRFLRGVRRSINEITLKAHVVPSEVKNRIAAALERSALVEARDLWIEADDRRVTLHGKVRSWVEREAAEQAAWAAPGVSRVENRIQVVHD